MNILSIFKNKESKAGYTECASQGVIVAILGLTLCVGFIGSAGSAWAFDFETALEDAMAAAAAGDWETVYDIVEAYNEAANSDPASYDPPSPPDDPPSYSDSYQEQAVSSPSYQTTVTVTDTGGVSPVTTQSVNDYLAQGYSVEQAAQQAAADATGRGYDAQAVPDGSGGWIVDFTGNCNNPDIVIDVDTECVSGCGEGPGGGGGGGGGTPGGPSPVTTPAPPTPPAAGGGDDGGGGGGDGGGGGAPPSNNSPSVSVSNPNNQLASTAPCTTNTYLSWTFSDPEDGANQSGYQIQIDDNGSFGSVNYDTGAVSSGIKERYIAVGSQINFNTTYYWRIRVRDSENAWSGWTSGSAFSTPVHAAPTPTFTSTPAHPSAGEAVLFTSTSTASGGASITAYEWNFQGGTPSSANTQSVSVTFATQGDQVATLRVTDSDSISCSAESSLTIEQNLPDFKEVPPLSAIDSFFLGIRNAFTTIADAAF